MTLDPDTCYKAVASHDSRFDGRFFVGVSSTGIYCRPVCRVRTPKRENCTFYDSAAAAEKQGFRPCLRCRPELAPGHGLEDIPGRLAQAAALMIDDGFMSDGSVAALAARIGVTERHLHRLFVGQFGVPISAYAQTQRLLLAKRLLTDTALPVTEVAHAAGFGSVRRFNDVLKTHYGLTPSALRKRADEGPIDVLAFELGYRPPFAWDALVAFLAARQVAGVEAVDGSGAAAAYSRTLDIEAAGRRHAGWLRIEDVPQRRVVRVAMSASLAGAVQQVLGRVRRLCDLGCRPDIVDAQLGALAESTPGIRLPGAVDGFEIAVRAVVGQVVSVDQARRVLARLAQAYGEPLQGLGAPPDTSEGGDGSGRTDDSPAALRVCFPRAAKLAPLAPDALRAIGIPDGKARAVLALAREVDAGNLLLEPAADPAQTIAQLTRIEGVGDWTAQYVAMRALGWPDAFPASDYALRKVLGIDNAGALRRHAARWAPWRAYAAMQLWRTYQERTC